MPVDNTLYERLNINSDSTANEIKKAYRKMSIKWHPDKNPNNKEEATEMFQKISEAYSILSDSEKRKKYDNYGMDFLKEGNQDFDPTSIFQEFFQGMGGMGGMGGFSGFPFGFQNNNKKKQEDCYIKKSISLKDIYNENKIKITFNQKYYCKTCDGTKCKSKKVNICKKCDGKGHIIQVVQMGPMIQQINRVCPDCNGNGEMIDKSDICEDCDGKGFKIKSKSIVIPLRNGLKTGNKIKLERKGHHFKNNKTDLIVEIIEIPDKNFKRDGNNLIIEMELKLYQGLIGFNKVIKHLDDKTIYINNKSPIKDGDIKIIKGLGMMDLSTGMVGDLHIIFLVKYPDLKKLSKEESDLLKVLLAKTEKEELEKESFIYKNRKKYKEYNLKDYEENDNYNETHHEGEQNCVQQ